jgi:hypothetical protein
LKSGASRVQATARAASLPAVAQDEQHASAVLVVVVIVDLLSVRWTPPYSFK